MGLERQIAVTRAERLRRDDPSGELASTPRTADDHAPPPQVADDAALLQRALSALPATTRSVLWLYHAEGYTHEEIAGAMQRSVSFSKSQLARGTRKLRALLESEGAALPIAEKAHA